jgi:hypothetical protein
LSLFLLNIALWKLLRNTSDLGFSSVRKTLARKSGYILVKHVSGLLKVYEMGKK